MKCKKLTALAVACIAVAIGCVWKPLGLDILVAVWVIRLFPKSAHRNIQACVYLTVRVGNKGVATQDLGASRGMISAAVQAMKRHPKVAWVQVACGNALESVALFNRAQSLAVRDADAIQAVINALRQFPMNKEVQKLTACLSSFNDYAPENRPIILQKGGIDLIFTAMKNFYNDSEVLFRTGCAISATSGDQGVAAAIAADDNIPFLMQMMRDHLKSYRVGQEIMQATRNLMMFDTPDRSHREVLLRNGFAKAALDTIKAEMHERGTPTIGSTNLGLLAHKNKTLQDQLLADGAVETILKAMNKYSVLDTSGYGGITTSDVWPTLPSASQAIWCLARNNSAVQARLVEAGAISLFVRLMKAYPTDLRILGYCCAALAEMAQQDEKKLQLIAEAGGVGEWCQPHLLGKASQVNLEHLESMIGMF